MYLFSSCKLKPLTPLGFCMSKKPRNIAKIKVKKESVLAFQKVPVCLNSLVFHTKKYSACKTLLRREK